jgi:ribonuclease P protein component
LREAVRASQVKPGWDAIFIARKGSEKANYQALKLAANNLLKRNQLVEAAGDAAQEGRKAETPG